MLKIAAEMNISETAFVRLLNDTDTFKTASVFGLRWFDSCVTVTATVVYISHSPQQVHPCP